MTLIWLQYVKKTLGGTAKITWHRISTDPISTVLPGERHGPRVTCQEMMRGERKSQSTLQEQWRQEK